MTEARIPHPDLPPPVSIVGPIGWLRRNLFSSPLNILLTLLTLYLLIIAIPPLLRWAVLNATWSGDTRDACQANSGACWVFIRVHFDQFMYGFYPEPQRWRVNLTLLLLIGSAAPLFIRAVPNHFKLRIGLGILVGFPIIAFILLTGGWLGLAPVETSQWGGLLLTLVIAGVGMTAALPLGVLLALGRRSQLPAIQTLCVVFIEFWRGVPLITVLFMSSVMLPLFLPAGMSFDKLLRALIGVSLFQAAYMAEVVRGGLQAIPKGQFEAAAALGLGFWKMMGLIVLPQAGHLAGADYWPVRSAEHRPQRHHQPGLAGVFYRGLCVRRHRLLAVLFRDVPLQPESGKAAAHWPQTLIQPAFRNLSHARISCPQPLVRPGHDPDGQRPQVVWRVSRPQGHQPDRPERRADRGLRSVRLRQVNHHPLHQPAGGIPARADRGGRPGTEQRCQTDRADSP